MMSDPPNSAAALSDHSVTAGIMALRMMWRDDSALAEALGPSGAHIIGDLDVQHSGSDETAVSGQKNEHQGDDGKGDAGDVLAEGLQDASRWTRTVSSPSIGEARWRIRPEAANQRRRWAWPARNRRPRSRRNRPLNTGVSAE